MVSCIAGVDEVGRGPLAGPVVAAAVILPPDHNITGLGDSKKLTPKRREVLALLIREQAIAWALGRAEVEEIDSINILQASLRAMERAVIQLSTVPQHVLVDGKHCPMLPMKVTAIIGGDATEPAISAASILAKVARDQEMIAMAQRYPDYGFEKHKGYGTRAHMAALAAQGPCAIHRLSFAPVAKALAKSSV